MMNKVFNASLILIGGLTSGIVYGILINILDKLI